MKKIFEAQNHPVAGADETTPSKAEYFTSISPFF